MSNHFAKPEHRHPERVQLHGQPCARTRWALARAIKTYGSRRHRLLQPGRVQRQRRLRATRPSTAPTGSSCRWCSCSRTTATASPCPSATRRANERRLRQLHAASRTCRSSSATARIPWIPCAPCSRPWPSCAPARARHRLRRLRAHRQPLQLRQARALPRRGGAGRGPGAGSPAALPALLPGARDSRGRAARDRGREPGPLQRGLGRRPAGAQPGPGQHPRLRRARALDQPGLPRRVSTGRRAPGSPCCRPSTRP